MRTNIVYHDNCNDGAACAMIAVHALGPGPGINCIPAKYGEPFDLDELRNSRVFILDFSFDRETLLALSEECQLIVLDHHETAQMHLAGIPGCIYEPDKCGARMTWEHFYGDTLPIPWWIEYIEDRDLWRWKLPYSKAVNAAIRSYGVSLVGLREALLWESGEAHREINALSRDGMAILRNNDNVVGSHIENAERVTMFGHEVLAVNATVLQSEIAGALSEAVPWNDETPPFGACWSERADGARFWSLRSSKGGVNVAELAKSAGGGGHAAAAGFRQAPGKPLP